MGLKPGPNLNIDSSISATWLGPIPITMAQLHWWTLKWYSSGWGKENYGEFIVDIPYICLVCSDHTSAPVHPETRERTILTPTAQIHKHMAKVEPCQGLSHSENFCMGCCPVAGEISQCPTPRPYIILESHRILNITSVLRIHPVKWSLSYILLVLNLLHNTNVIPSWYILFNRVNFERLEQVYDERFARQYGFFRPYAELIVMRSPLFAVPANLLFWCILTPHKRLVPQRGNLGLSNKGDVPPLGCASGRLSRRSPLGIALQRTLQVTGHPDHLEVIGFVKVDQKIAQTWCPPLIWVLGKKDIIIMRST